MEVEIKEEEKEVLLNLIEKYLYEFSQWEKTDVNVEGNYGYEYLDCYFEEENRYPYFIKVDGKLAGFAMISDYPEVPEETTDYCLSELFVMHKQDLDDAGEISDIIKSASEEYKTMALDEEVQALPELYIG